MTYSVSVAEDALANTLIKNLSVINRTNDLLPVSCEIVSGNSEGIRKQIFQYLHKMVLIIILFSDAFYMKESADRNCELRLKKTLDFEATQRYEIEVQLKTSASFVNQDRSTVRVNLNAFLRIEFL
jgi:hypothetical protein